MKAWTDSFWRWSSLLEVWERPLPYSGLSQADDDDPWDRFIKLPFNFNHFYCYRHDGVSRNGDMSVWTTNFWAIMTVDSFTIIPSDLHWCWKCYVRHSEDVQRLNRHGRRKGRSKAPTSVSTQTLYIFAMSHQQGQTSAFLCWGMFLQSHLNIIGLETSLFVTTASNFIRFIAIQWKYIYSRFYILTNFYVTAKNC